MPRLLIISPHFPPINAPDMQRVRMSLPHFVDAGWEVVVLTVDDREPQAPLEPELLLTIPAAVRVIRVPVFSRRWTRLLGMNNLGLRALPFIHSAANSLLSQEHFDIVYFSMTQFILMPLGRVWQRDFGVPYVIDLQDPWLNEYYNQPGAPRPPGGWKYIFAHATARILEGWTLRRAAHVLSVSEVYLTTLAKRYSWWTPDHGSVLTFGAPDSDLEIARKKMQSESALLPQSNTIKIAYAGRLGPDMLPSLEHLIGAISHCRHLPRPFEIFFFGTSYAPAGQAKSTTGQLADKYGVADLVHERPARIGYIDSLRLMLEADLALLLGSEDKAYSPSKIYPTLISRRPTLAIAPGNSVLQQKIEELGGARLLTFNPEQDYSGSRDDPLVKALQQFSESPAAPFGALLNEELLMREYTSRAISARQLEIFNRIIRKQHLQPTALSLGAYWPEIARTKETPTK